MAVLTIQTIVVHTDSPNRPDGRESKEGRETEKGEAYLGTMRLHRGLHRGSQSREPLHPVRVELVLVVQGKGYPRRRWRVEGEGGVAPGLQ